MLSYRASLACFALGIVSQILSASSPPKRATIQGPPGLSVSIDNNGFYQVATEDPAWQLGGELGAPPTNLVTQIGTDGIGLYSEIGFDYTLSSPRHGEIRAYSDHMVVLFSVTYPSGGANDTAFPAFSGYPEKLTHLTFSGTFAEPSFTASGDQGPWVFFDSGANTFILSPASDFLTSSTKWGAKPSRAIESAMSPAITELPPGFTHQTMLVIDKGINQTFETWGHAMTDLQRKTRPSNEADVSLRALGYWTDAGSKYYYHRQPLLSYPETLLAVKNDFEKNGIALGYVQLDSWFYPKGAQAQWNDHAHGIFEYRAADSLFPNGLESFQRQLALPLITHSRWIDAESPYRHQYEMSGNVVTDPRYWRRVAGYLQNAGVVTYEQDWLATKAQPNLDLTGPYAFLNNMAEATARHGLTMQYCMAGPQHFLESTKYSNLTTIRTSEDRLNRNHWTKFLITGRLASALGMWPFADVFLSTETENLLFATLSAGPIGVGDSIGGLSKENLLKAVRPDGLIVKPDVPLTPLDASFFSLSEGLNNPMIAATYTDFPGFRAHYVFAYDMGGGTAPALTYSDLGIDSAAYAYDYFADAGHLVNPTDAFPAPASNGQSYTIVVPVGPSGIAVLGDRGHFASFGKKRITEFADNGQARIGVAFAAGEAVRTIHGYSPSAPHMTALNGRLGAILYDSQTHRFMVEVAPGTGQAATVQISR